MSMRKPNPRHPNMRGDFGDIGDIFRKPSNHAVLLAFESGDILGMSPRDGDAHRGCRGCVVSCVVPMRAKAHLVTICHRPFEWPFFRVSGVERRIDGFSFGWRRNAPKRAVLGPYRIAHRIDRCGAHAWGVLRAEAPGSDAKRIRLWNTSSA